MTVMFCRDGEPVLVSEMDNKAIDILYIEEIELSAYLVLILTIIN